VLRALADENEFVRDTAYKAGQRLVMMYADSAITLLLPGKYPYNKSKVMPEYSKSNHYQSSKEAFSMIIGGFGTHLYNCWVKNSYSFCFLQGSLNALKPIAYFLGDLLYKISGVSGKMTTETAGEDDNFGTEQSQIAIYRRLGEVRCHSVLAGLYMGRSDVALMVRQVKRRKINF